MLVTSTMVKKSIIIDETWRELAKELLPVTQMSWFLIEETKKRQWIYKKESQKISRGSEEKSTHISFSRRIQGLHMGCTLKTLKKSILITQLINDISIYILSM